MARQTARQSNGVSEVTLSTTLNVKTIRVRILSLVVSVIACSAALKASDSTQIDIPPVVRFMRVIASTNSSTLPILLVNQRNPTLLPVYGAQQLKVELDVQANVPPAIVLTFKHCRADWTEDANVFMNDAAFMRSINIDWQNAPPSSTHYTYRGSLSFPSQFLKIPYGGNWKVQAHELTNDTMLLAEARFFAIDCAVTATLDVIPDFYTPRHRASPVGIILEASVTSNSLLSDLQLNTAVFYRLNRWYEPYSATRNSNLSFGSTRGIFNPSSINGIANAGKRFRVEQIPAETDYRVLDLTNIAQYPHSSVPIRLPLTDIPRAGGILEIADNGSMTTTGISYFNDEYVPIEFILDPQGKPSIEDVFVVGSMNNWHATADWQMVYNPEERLYKLRQWVRRARHNYIYASGRVNADTQVVENLNTEEFEGNNISAGHIFVAFIYFQDPSYGGYDNIVGVAAASIYGPVLR